MNSHRAKYYQPSSRVLIPAVIALGVLLICFFIIPLFQMPVRTLDAWLARTQYAVKNTLNTSQNLTSPEINIPRIISHPPQTLYDSLLLNWGNDHDVTLGDRIIVDDLVIGEVIRVFPHTAQVMVYTSPDNSMMAVHAISDTRITVKGRGGGSFSFTAPHDMSITMGDSIQDISGKYILGMVRHITSDPRDPLKTVYVGLPISFARMNEVSILKNS
jgi:cell shape-determining protein MreC